MSQQVWADFMAFLFSQLNLMHHQDCVIHPWLDLDFAHITIAPPFMQLTDDILRERDWLHSIIEMQPHRTKFFYGLQHPPVDASFLNMRRLADAGVKFCTIAYQDENMYGGGFAANSRVGLSENGYGLLRSLADCGMVLDLSHSNNTTARDAIDYIACQHLPLKIVATHVGLSCQYEHKRNFPLEILKRIIDMGGLVGIPLVTFLLHPDDDSCMPFLSHARKAVDCLGEGAVCIGSDSIYQCLSRSEALMLHEAMLAGIDPNGDFNARPLNNPQELNGPEKLHVLADIMASNGFQDRVIRAVLGENLANFFATL
ncbi:MAG: hypothetical protein RIQ54_62 [Candidatus Parcubacteria bacterium]|jgi:microsomal dipeptidase-like Zn-dependent dipeptidase